MEEISGIPATGLIPAGILGAILFWWNEAKHGELVVEAHLSFRPVLSNEWPMVNGDTIKIDNTSLTKGYLRDSESTLEDMLRTLGSIFIVAELKGQIVG